MATEVKLPELGENVPGGQVVDIKVSPGADVREGQPLVEVEAEKASVEVPSPLAGRLVKFLVKKGDHVNTGQTLCLIEDGQAKPEEAKVPKKEARAQDESPAKEPERPQQQAPPKQPARAAPPVTADGAASRGAPQGREAAKPSTGAVVPAGPATRHLARELGVDLSRVTGTGPLGRVTPEDVKAFVRQLASGDGRPAAAQAPPLPDFAQWGPIERKPLETIRRRTAEHLSLAWTLIPHVTHHDLADVTELDAFRKQQDSKGPKITVTAFALKAAAIVLRQFPQFNSSLDMAGNQLIVKQYYHIGVAVDTERGLLVPVVRDVDKKSVQELAQELTDLAERARQKKLTADDMRGATFTISNLGGIGGTGFTPIINYPEVAILGLSRSRTEPVWKDGAFVPRLLLPLSLSYDHRVIDGADAARFTRRLAEMLENPLVMLLHA